MRPTGKTLQIEVSDELLGTTLDGLGRPMDQSKQLNGVPFKVNRSAPDPFRRNKIEQVIPTGIKAIDGLLTIGEGQRVGIFAGSGVGKSTLLGMIARYCEADVIVIGLIGERGREVLEFIEKDLGEEGYRKSVVVCAYFRLSAVGPAKGCVCCHRDSRILQGSREKSDFDDGFRDACRYGTKGNRIGYRGTAHLERVYAFSVHRPSEIIGAKRHVRTRFDHCLLHRPG